MAEDFDLVLRTVGITEKQLEDLDTLEALRKQIMKAGGVAAIREAARSIRGKKLLQHYFFFIHQIGKIPE